MGGPPDEGSSASRVRAKPKAARSPNGPLFEKREKWRTPSLFRVNVPRQPRVMLFALTRLSRRRQLVTSLTKLL